MTVASSLLRLLVTAVIAVFTTATTVAAQFSVEELEVHLKPDGSGAVSAVIPVLSDADSLLQLQVVMADWERDSVGNNMFVDFGSLTSSCVGRIEVFPATLQLAPRSTGSIRVTYTGRGIPDPGCWSAVSVSAVRAPSTSRGVPTAEVNVVYVVKVYVHATSATLAGEVISADVEEGIELPRGAADSVGFRQLAVRFANTGSAHLVVKTQLELRASSTELLSRTEGSDVYITPGAFRDILMRLPDLPRGRYAAILLLDYGAEEIMATQVEFEVP